MARKHEKFTYSYGWRTAPEQWRFQWYGKQIQLDVDTRSQVAMLMLEGRETEAEAILKRLLRKQEKAESYICIGFYTEDGKEYYFTQTLQCRMDDFRYKIYAFKEWKRYIKERDCLLSAYQVTTGYLMSNGKMTEGKEEKQQSKIDLKKPCTIRLVKPIEERVFQF